MLNLSNVLFVHSTAVHGPELEHLKKSFCGRVVLETVIAASPSLLAVYACGDVEKIVPLVPEKVTLFVVRDFSTNIHVHARVVSVSVGQVPLMFHGVGVFFPKLFADERMLFEKITKEHDFQALTLSDKPGSAFRRGIYLTRVEAKEDQLFFRLLRCSTNLAGPTDNLRETDVSILHHVNSVRPFFFPDSAELNHVLAQTYHNSEAANGKQKKAKISEHSDKTKDMPTNGLLAFCTFYEGFQDDFEKLGSEKSGFDFVYGKGTSILTKLRFRLKPQAKELNKDLVEQFDVTLFPNSVYIMSLLANRWYTHEIVPSALNVEKIPTRLGYVIRCSDSEAIHVDGQTLIKRHKDGQMVKLEEPDKEGLKLLRDLYYQENTTIDVVDYRDRFFFSMNSGDYKKPIL